MAGNCVVIKVLASAIGPALFLASTSTVKQFVKPSPIIPVSFHLAWDFTVGAAFLAVLMAQSIANYKLAKMRQGDGALIQPEQDPATCRYINVTYFAYAMAAFKGVFSTLAFSDASTQLPRCSVGDGIDIMLFITIPIACLFGLNQMYGQLGSLLVKAESEGEKKAWRKRAAKISPAIPAIVGSGADAWFYNVSFYHAFSTIIDLYTNQTEALLSVPLFASEYLNPVFCMLVVYNVLTWIVISKAWLEKWNNYLDEYAPGLVYSSPACFESIVDKVMFTTNDNAVKIDRPYVRNMITHFKALTGGLAAAAIIIDMVNDSDINTRYNNVNLLQCICPVVVIVGHWQLSELHNLVNSAGGHIANVHTLFSGRCCRAEYKDDADSVLLEDYTRQSDDFKLLA